MSEQEPSINSLLRINPEGFVSETIDLDLDVKEISLLKPDMKKGNSYDTWIYENAIDSADRFSKGLKFSNQEGSYKEFSEWYESNIDPTRGANALTCIAVGGRGSGKSYTLFGDDTRSGRGIIPRFLASRFDSENGHQGAVSFMLISMYLVSGDTLFDLFNPPSQFSVSDHNFTYSDSLGVLPLPTKYLRTDSATHGLQLIHLGLMTASMIALNSDFIFNGVDIVVSMRMFQPDCVNCMTFVEASSMLFLPSSAAVSDRFSNQVHEVRSANACSDSSLFGSVWRQSNQKKKMEKAMKSINSSFLTYLLQDAFLLAGHPLYPTNLTATLLIGCLRGDLDSFSENKFTLNMILTIAERFQNIIEEATAGPEGFDRSLASGSTDRSSRPRSRVDKPNSRNERSSSRGSRIGIASAGLVRRRSNSNEIDDDSITKDPHKSLTFEILSNHLQREIALLQSSMDRDNEILKMMEVQKTSAEDMKKVDLRLKFLARKQKYLKEFSNQVKDFNMTKKMKKSDLKGIVNWLKERGLVGLRFNKDHDVNAPEHKIRKYTEPAGSLGVIEEVEISNMPWSSDGMPTEPYIVPISPIGLSSSYLLMRIPPGHMAVCQKCVDIPPEENIVTSQDKPLAFTDSKHTKLLLLGSIHINHKHCMFFRVDDTIKLNPLVDDDKKELGFVEVNGQVISEQTVLQDLDVIRIGSSTVFVVHIPEGSDNEENDPFAGKTREDSTKDSRLRDKMARPPDIESALPASYLEAIASGYWDDCIYAACISKLRELIRDFLQESNVIKHTEADRALTLITPTKDLNTAQKITRYQPTSGEIDNVLNEISIFHKALISEVILAVETINYWASEMRKDVYYTVHLRPRPVQNNAMFLSRQYRGAEQGIKIGDKVYDVSANCEVLDGGVSSGRGDSWWWSVTILLQRVSLMKPMYSDFIWKFDRNLMQLDNNFPPSKDPFLDPSKPELIGVSNIHLDSLYYLMDVRDTVPIVTFRGDLGGLLKFSLRCWIDQVDTIPNYIKVDEECKLPDFMGRKCIMKFYFESLLDINPTLSNDVHVSFNFFVHSGQYKTPRHTSRNIKLGDQHPYLNNIVVVEQTITPDFIQYVQRNSIELEIWGGRIFNQRILSVPDGPKRKKYYLGDPRMPRSAQVRCNYYSCYFLYYFEEETFTGW